MQKWYCCFDCPPRTAEMLTDQLSRQNQRCFQQLVINIAKKCPDDGDLFGEFSIMSLEKGQFCFQETKDNKCVLCVQWTLLFFSVKKGLVGTPLEKRSKKGKWAKKIFFLLLECRQKEGAIFRQTVAERRGLFPLFVLWWSLLYCFVFVKYSNPPFLFE